MKMNKWSYSLLEWHEFTSFQIPDCQIDKDEEPGVTDFVAQVQKSKIVVSTPLVLYQEMKDVVFEIYFEVHMAHHM